MSGFLAGWAAELWRILVESGPWLLVGFVVAGYLRALIREELVFRHLGRDDFRSVAIAALVGAPLPLCSCSVIPTAIALRRSGASKGATTSFLISTPETGVDSIGITWALLDPVMTVMRPLSALVTAFTSGAFVNVLARRGWDAAPAEPEPAAAHACCADEHGDEAGEHEPALAAEPPPRGFRAATRRALGYAFGPLMADLTPAFLVGFALSALIAVLVPESFFREVLPGGWVSMLAMLVVGIPIYVCAAASTPVAAVMIAKGLEPGAALVLLLAGPATNLATIAVVKRFLGGRVLAVYLGSIAVCALGLGWVANAIYAALGAGPQTIAAGLESRSPGLVSILAGAALALLFAWHAFDLRLASRWGAALRRACAPLGFDPTSRAAKGLVLALALLAWASTALGVVRPGEVGFRLRFGRVVERLEEPGLHLMLPWPLESLDSVRAAEVRGLRSADEGEARGATQVVTGDENLLSIEHAVHYRVSDAQRFRFALAEPEQLLGALSEAALRRAAARRATDELLVGDRPGLEREVRADVQEELDALRAGLELVAFELLDVHAPAEVHAAYRDVASAAEDVERQERRAERYAKELVAEARATAFRREQAAAAEADATLQQARGEARAFLDLLEAQAGAPELLRTRARLEAAERALARPRLVLVLEPGVEVVPIERGLEPAAVGGAREER